MNPADKDLTSLELQKVKYYFNNTWHTTKLTYSDASHVYIFIFPGDMVYVTDCNYSVLCQRIEADDLDSYEAYDLSDGHCYFLASKYADEICDAFIDLTNRLYLHYPLK